VSLFLFAVSFPLQVLQKALNDGIRHVEELQESARSRRGAQKPGSLEAIREVPTQMEQMPWTPIGDHPDAKPKAQVPRVPSSLRNLSEQFRTADAVLYPREWSRNLPVAPLTDEYSVFLDVNATPMLRGVSYSQIAWKYVCGLGLVVSVLLSVLRSW